ncbi:MAG: uracil-DNA glycosylase [Pirellulales bacterium]
MTARREDRSSRAVTAALQTLESLRQAGVRQLSKPGRGMARDDTERAAPAGESQLVPLPHASGLTPRGLFAEPVAAPGDSLEVIRREVAACTLCDELAATRTQTVFGVGNPRARLCFLGEAPGADEDAQGEPFVGRAGQLLTRIIEACALSRSDVYILNVLKCRPPGNRNPHPHEVANCRGFLDRQLAQIRPEFICCLGSIAAQTLLETQMPIGRMRGKFFQYEGIDVMCTYHPAYLLRNPAAKKDVWEDMKMLMEKMGVEIKAEGRRQKAE